MHHTTARITQQHATPPRVRRNGPQAPSWSSSGELLAVAATLHVPGRRSLHPVFVMLVSAAALAIKRGLPDPQQQQTEAAGLCTGVPVSAPMNLLAVAG
jgi:hypothetical protein